MIDVLVQYKVFETIVIVLGTIILIWEYVKVFKGTSCKKWLEKPEKARREGRVIIATHVKHKHRTTGLHRGNVAGAEYTFATYKYDINGKTKQKVIHFGGHEDPPETLMLYYSRTPLILKTEEEFTHSRIRRFWPWIKMAIVCAPIMWLLNQLNLIHF